MLKAIVMIAMSLIWLSYQGVGLYQAYTLPSNLDLSDIRTGFNQMLTSCEKGTNYDFEKCSTKAQ